MGTEIEYSLHPETFTCKPDKFSASRISSTIHQDKTKTDLRRFVEEIGKGKTWSACFFGERSKKTWTHQQVFAADLDSGEFDNIYQILQQCLEKKVEPFCVHPTFSSTPNFPKWRVIFYTPVPVLSEELALSIQRCLALIFDGDIAVCDISRLFYGGKASDNWYIDLNASPLVIGDLDLQSVSKTRVKKEIKEPERDTIYTSPKAKFYKTYISEQKLKVLSLGKGSGYLSVWHSSYKLGKIKELTKETIYIFVKKWVDSSELYSGWKHYDRLQEIVENGVQYGRKHPL